jgi:regulator of protease activity HflC (stomatin/prohibitin superfamily)
MNFLSSIFGFFKSFQFWVVVAPWELGLRIRLGKTAVVLRPGPHIRIPFLDRMYVQPTRLRTISGIAQTVTTKDVKAFTVGTAVMYQIADILKLHMAVANPESSLLNLIYGVISKIVTDRLSTELTLETLETQVIKELPTADWGLSDVKLIVTTFAFTRVLRLLNTASYEYQNTSQTNNLSATTDVQG